GLGRDGRLKALVLQSRAEIGGTAILPDDGAMNGLAGGAIPHQRRLALVGDADRGDVLCREARLLQRLAADRNRRIPDVLRVVLHPTGSRKMLRKLGLRDGCDRKVGAKHHRARRRGALIDGEHEGHWRSPRFVCSQASGLKEEGQGLWFHPPLEGEGRRGAAGWGEDLRRRLCLASVMSASREPCILT